MPRSTRVFALRLVVSAAFAVAASAQDPATAKDPLRIVDGDWAVKFGLFAGSQVVVEDNAFWGLAAIVAPTADYDADRAWLENWFVPGVHVDRALTEATSLYGGLALAATGNVGRDVFEQGREGRASLERAFVGVRHRFGEGRAIDLSAGQQEYRYGSGMLVHLGAQNGNQRGAALVSPRRAWEFAAVARLEFDGLGVDAFLLDYNEATPDDPDTKLAGGKVDYRFGGEGDDSAVGIAYVRCLESTFPYIQAPLTFDDRGRDGTSTLNPWLRWRPLAGSLPGLLTTVEYAQQWNSRNDLDAEAISAEVSHQWLDHRMRPRIAYAFRQFGGDDPSTAGLERFDPLFYDGGVHAFASGSNAALTFFNSNVRTHRLAMEASLTARDVCRLSCWRVEAVETGSPLQFGQFGRIETVGGQPALVTGVPFRHLSDDFYLEYVRVVSANVYLTLGTGVSIPARGLEAAAGESLDPWIGGLANFTVVF